VPYFKRLTEQEKREIGDNAVSLYETFAVLREVFATASNSTFFGPFFLARKKARKIASGARLKESSRGVWREALEREQQATPLP